ncbi:MAG: MFS transporter [Planctomycetaceae bacterium]|uniref:L-galactonate transporter n=1 Tax=Lacipirellula limnantheis TaxID=2528024 RepID=A0A517U4P4_9BACT|nr:MFS transporter [Lacipirellula limnantheis]MBL9162226.1 MFS transporter [Planctomycetaceae bacterium]QDT75606.1 L-galactonate transporter [Lacipirellula limnantheis]
MATPTPLIAGDDSAYAARIWPIASLLLLASAINYMDRQTLSNTSVRITEEFGMSQEQYGNLEAGFGWAFAVGSLFFGFVADRVSLRWLYAAVLVLWSAMGFASGFVQDYDQLLLCRTLLGFFEAGHWPCGIKTVRAILDSRGRAMGNGVLQSGTSIGAIVTPLIMRWMLTDEVGSWRLPFQAVGAVGVFWAVAWLIVTRGDSLRTRVGDESAVTTAWWRVLLDRRMFVILGVIALINTTFQILRAWLPKFLQEGRGYEEAQALYFNAVWFGATDVGCLGAGAVALWLARRGQSVLTARMMTFFACALMALATVAVPWLPAGWLLLALLLIAGAGALGVFPIYHAFTQDLSQEHQGKVTGVAGVAAWAFSPLGQQLFGRHVDATHSFDEGIAIVGCLPMAACLLLFLFWPRSTTARET